MPFFRSCLSNLCERLWIRLLNYMLGNALVKWLPSECIREDLPNIYKLKGHNLLYIIDCLKKVFIERPKITSASNFYLWSDYNLIQSSFLYASHHWFYHFLSDSYRGRAAVNFLVMIVDLLSFWRAVMIMADCGFQIKELLM